MQSPQKPIETYPDMKRGILFALSAYVIWGIAPVYFKLLEHVPAEQIVAFRIFFSCFFMIILVSFYNGWKKVKAVFRAPRKLLWLFIASHLIGLNWFIFIWSVNNHHVLDTSLGYFINPLINILIGTLFLSEKLRPIQWTAVGLTVLAVLYQVWQFNSIPYIALSLAITFSIYGLVKKKIAIDAQTSMFLETMMLLPASAMLFIFIVDDAHSVIANYSIGFIGIIALSGVITTVPLIFFSAAASKIPFSYLGFFQYIGPSMGFVLAITLFGETLTVSRLITFGIIWFALVLIIFDGIKKRRHMR
ncbi:EamA family transporter RarD [Thorsellia anophelis]|uniref:Chloramphenicol-sensitive protein RarD n=1 Tax=Thorsellia anophelis DSM 18579 TaxID=1123402 RepID=A0A1H9ZP42_9GAMM|nr:EamA family transporter RarD [Thorsellia anophelis]SES83534.1 chloramphenicol-sensitive protein RarD [Thorsellia anophelis DSM 18579]